MDKVKIAKEKLLKKLRENRSEHNKTFKDALAGWKRKVMDELEEALRLAKIGEKFEVYFHLPKPEHHLKEYDDVIEAVSWHEDSFVELSRTQFTQLVRDEWSWSNNFASTSSMYTGYRGKQHSL